MQINHKQVEWEGEGSVLRCTAAHPTHKYVFIFMICELIFSLWKFVISNYNFSSQSYPNKCYSNYYNSIMLPPPQITYVILGTRYYMLAVVVNVTWKYLLLVTLQYLHVPPCICVPYPPDSVVSRCQNQVSLGVELHPCHLAHMSFLIANVPSNLCKQADVFTL